MATRNLFEYRKLVAKSILFDDFETSWGWTMLGNPTYIAAGLTATNPFRGSLCGYLSDASDADGGIVYKEGLTLAAPQTKLEFAVRFVGKFPNDTWQGEVYLYHPTDYVISTWLVIGGGGTVKYLDNTGWHTLYAGTAGQWFYFKITETWGSRKFDIELYDVDMNLLASVSDIDMWYSSSGTAYPPLAFVTAIIQEGTLYFDNVDIDP